MSDDAPTDVTYEYAIEVPGQGWLMSIMPGTYSVHPEPQVLTGDLEDLQETLRKTKNIYRRMGAAVVGDELRLVVRTVTVVRSDWADA